MATEQDEVVKITLEVVDKFSKPLDNLMRELDKIDKQDAGAKTKKSFDGLKDSVSGVAQAFKTLTPGLAGTVGIFSSLAVAIGAVAKAMHDFAGNIDSLQRLSHATGFGAERMRELEAVARRFGVTAGEVRAGMRGLADSFHDIKRGGPIFQELARSGLPHFANQLRNAKTDAERLELVLRQVDRLKDPYEKRRLLGMLRGPEVFAEASGPERKKLEEEYRKTNPPLDKEGLDKVKRYEDSLWRSQNAVDAIIQKNVGDLDTLAIQLDTMAKGTLAATDALGSFNKTMDAVRKNGEETGEAIRRKFPKSPGRPLTIWEQLFGYKPENQSYTDPGGSKTKDAIKSATSEGVVEGFVKFAMLVGGRGSDGGGGGGAVIRASLGGGNYGGGVRSAASPPPPLGGKASSGAAATAGGGTDTSNDTKAVPTDILAEARRVAALGGPGAVAAYMREKGHPKSGAWCGEFAAAVVSGSGGTPPRNPAVASNWRNFGERVVGDPQPGDVAVRRGPRTGSTGSHVTIVEGYDPKTHRFTGIGGNQGGIRSTFPTEGRRGYDFFRAHREREQASVPLPRPRPMMHDDPSHARERLRDASNKAAQFAKVEGNASVRIDLNGFPRGTRTAASSGGIFSSVELHRGNTLPLASESG